ncbi:MAG: EAL domain-containing protein [Acidobacteriota bacterium]|nr:EAL domain-containing protein [Acidobacteriota bacterium]
MNNKVRGYNSNLSVSGKLIVGFGLAGAVLIALVSVSYLTTRKLIEDIDGVAHSHEVQEELVATVSTLIDAEAGQRGYLFSGDESFLPRYHKAIAQLDLNIQHLRQLIADDPKQQLHIAPLEEKIAERLNILQSRIDMLNEQGIDATRQAFVLRLGAAKMNEIRQLVAAMQEEERLLLQRRTASSQASVRNNFVAMAVGGLTYFILLFFIYYLIHRHLAARQQAEECTAYEATHDSLTSLPNRSLFTEHLKTSIARAKRHQDYQFAVLFLDLDRFKVMNDSLGHVVADKFLVIVAHKLQSLLRPEDVVARFGGDEFTILLDNTRGITDAIHVAERINAELQTPVSIDGNELSTAVSIGITSSMDSCTEPEQCLRDADMAMYRAKAIGTGRYEMFDKSMHARAVTRMSLETALRKALEREEFILHYQPIIAIETGLITGFEALIRWLDPERGLIPPDAFIAVAEENGLIVPIGQWGLSEACRQMRQWHVQFPANPSLNISVNLSPKQFSQVSLVKQIEKILRETELDANSLKLEITESTVVGDAASATSMLWQLKELGVGLEIDDFGIGYSSLSYLSRFPVDTLKIDRSFVSKMNGADVNYEVVRTIVALGHNLGMEVTAEGIETAEQLSQLKDLRCDHGQGYLFSRPVAADAVATLLGVNTAELFAAAQ